MRCWSLAALALALGLAALSACQAPPKSAYVAAAVADRAAQDVAAGKDSRGDDCRRVVLGDGANIFCSDWARPSARIRRGALSAHNGVPGPAQLAALAEGSGAAAGWRAELDERYKCGDPQTTTILDGAPAVTLDCAYRNVPFRRLALVAAVGGQVWYADTLATAFAPTERTIGVLAGVEADTSGLRGAAGDPLLAERLAASDAVEGDIDTYDALERQAADANRGGDIDGAAALYRRLVAQQEKRGQANDRALAKPLMLLALQLSNEGHYTEADADFGRAERLLGPDVGEDDLWAQLDQYRGLHLIHQDRAADALPLFQRAEESYCDVAGALPQHGRTGTVYCPVADASRATNAGLTAEYGAVDVLRDSAWALRRLGHIEDSEAEARQADEQAVILRSRVAGELDVRRPATIQGLRFAESEAAFLDSTYGLTVSQAGRADSAAALLVSADQEFAATYAGTRRLALAKLHAAAELLRNHRSAEVLDLCQQAVDILRVRRTAVEADDMAPCLAAYGAAAAGADAQDRFAEMFEAAQLARSSETNQTIQSAAREMSDQTGAIKRRDEAQRALDAAEERAAQLALEEAADPAKAVARTQALKDAAAARHERDTREEELQAAVPGYNRLVPKVVSAREVMAKLRPGEAFVQTVLGPSSGWTFLLRDGQIRVGRIEAGRTQVRLLVEKLRNTLEPDRDDAVSPFDMATSYDLYRLVLAPVADELNGAGTLIVAPAGPLLSVPFGVLLTAPARKDDYAGAHWLVLDHAIVQVPEPGNFVALRALAGTSKASESWFGFGPAVNVAKTQALASFRRAGCADADNEAEGLASLPRLDTFAAQLAASARILHASPDAVLQGARFTASAVERLPLARYRVLQFAAHGLSPTDLSCQPEAALVTSADAGAADADGAFLTAGRIARLHLDANLVILSACSSGGPEGRGGEALSGLARSFFAANARTLLVTHWAAYADQVSVIIPDVLAAVQANPDAGLGAALQAAQLHWLRSHTAAVDLHPAVWGVLSVFGDGGWSGAPTTASAARGGAIGLSSPPG